MTGKFWTICLAAGAVLLAGCDETTLMRVSGGDPAYDGRWTGRMAFSIGLASCPRRGALALDLSGGVFSGDVRFPELEARRVMGKVIEGGEVAGGEIKRGPIPWADVTGSFNIDGTASGRWKTRECEGSWEARRVAG